MTGEQHPAAARVCRARDQVEHGALAAAARPHDGQELALGQRELEVGQRRDLGTAAPVRLADPFEDDDCVHACSFGWNRRPVISMSTPASRRNVDGCSASSRRSARCTDRCRLDRGGVTARASSDAATRSTAIRAWRRAAGVAAGRAPGAARGRGRARDGRRGPGGGARRPGDGRGQVGPGHDDHRRPLGRAARAHAAGLREARGRRAASSSGSSSRRPSSPAPASSPGSSDRSRTRCGSTSPASGACDASPPICAASSSRAARSPTRT